MHLAKLNIDGYRGFKDRTTIELNQGLNVILGENGCGKSTVIDAIRLLLFEDEYSRYGVSEGDFNRDFITGEKRDEIKIKGIFTDLTEEQKSVYLTWLNNDFNAELNLIISNEYDGRYKFKRKFWGGVSRNSIFDWEVMNDIQCVYLPALRDAEKKLRSSRGSRLARLLKNLNKEELVKVRENGDLLDIEERFNKFNKELEDDKNIKNANDLINKNLKESLGSIFGQSTKIQFNELNFEKIVESLRLLYFPKITDEKSNYEFRNLSENSLGYNNLIYLATILAEFEGLKSEYQLPRILLIEEPEAHLHPQLQAKLLKFLESQAKDNNIQVIISTHSPTIASSVSLNKIKVMCITEEDKINYIPLENCGLEKKTEKFLNRWLDTTKSTLLFSKGVILVEGLAEAILIPKLASIVLEKENMKDSSIPLSLEEAGISVINMNGIYFDHFMQLYNGYKLNIPKGSKEYIKEFKEKEIFKDSELEETASIPIRCVGITDNDPDKDYKPTKIGLVDRKNFKKGKNRCLYLGQQLSNMTDNCRLFYNLKTFEYDMALYRDNLKIMIEVFLENLETDGSIKESFEQYQDQLEEGIEKEDEIADIAFGLLQKIESTKMGKGLYAQQLLEKTEDNNLDLTIPNYIEDAIKWVIGSAEGENIDE